MPRSESDEGSRSRTFLDSEIPRCARDDTVLMDTVLGSRPALPHAPLRTMHLALGQHLVRGEPALGVERGLAAHPGRRNGLLIRRIRHVAGGEDAFDAGPRAAAVLQLDEAVLVGLE